MKVRRTKIANLKQLNTGCQLDLIAGLIKLKVTLGKRLTVPITSHLVKRISWLNMKVPADLSF